MSHHDPSGAHPRVGGENASMMALILAKAGSSPRGRGKLARNVRQGRGYRLIPAWAGKTTGCPQTTHGSPAHPRVGGENAGRSKLRRAGKGSSPRGRGKLCVCPCWCFRRRLIPAWAGKTTPTGREATRSTAHPRVGGENIQTTVQAVAGWGSSPRGRGKPTSTIEGAWGNRLIPAWAGKTGCRRSARGPPRAHPRVGGENLNAVAGGNADTGSSPRGRGKLCAALPAALRLRLIPAWAGKTVGDGGHF